MNKARFAASLLLVMAGPVGAAGIDTGRQDELMYLLKQDCGSCHGLALKGGLGPALLPGLLAGKPKESLVQTILMGRPGTAMPPWKALLTPDEAEWITDRLMDGLN